MRIYFLGFIFIILFTNKIYSQFSVSGNVIDGDNYPIELVEVQIQNIDSVIIGRELTTSDGRFEIILTNGEYKLLVKQAGVVLHSESILVSENNYLGNIIIGKQQLKEVIIVTKKKLIQRKVDRTVFNVENSIAASGGDALDALGVTPNIRVLNDKIVMIGKSGMRIMVDDVLIPLSGDDLINYLKSISSDNIKLIEIITTPPAKYSAEGNSGLVNIKLKRSKKDSWNAALNTSYRQSKYALGNIGGNFNFQKDNFSVFSNLNYTNGATAPLETSNIYYPDGLWSNYSMRKDFTEGISGRIGADIKINNKLTMGVQYLGGNFIPNIAENNETFAFNNSNEIKSFISTQADNRKKSSYTSLNYHIIYDLDSIGTKISADLDYFNYYGNDNRTFNSNLISLNSLESNQYFSANNQSGNKLNNYSAKIDVEMPLKILNLSFGGKLSSSNNKSDVLFYDLTNGEPVYDSNQSNMFSYDETISSFYFSMQRKINEKWETQIGLRMESTNTEGVSMTLDQTNINSYTRFFPTAYVTYSLDEDNIFSLNYSKRIDRPTFFSLNPFRWYDNPYSYAEGNPFLQPAFSHNIEFSFTKNQNWENKIFFSKILNGFSQLSILDTTTNIQAYTYNNFFNTEIFGLSESYTFNKYDWWESVNSVDLSYSKTDSEISITNQNREGFNSSLSTDNTFYLNSRKSIMFNISFWIEAAGVSQLDKNTASNQTDLSVKFLFLNKNLQLTFVGNDIFSSYRPTYTSFSNNIKQEYKNYYDNRFFRISLSYKFGNEKIKIARRDLGNEDELMRTK